jgi:hypothetical protein
LSDVAKSVLVARQESVKGKDLVDDLLYQFREASGDDRRLYWRYITQVLGVRLSFSEASKLFKGFSSDTLGRRRRELIQEAIEKGDEASLHYLLPLPGTRHKRVVRCRVMRDYYSQRELWDFELLE